MPNRAAARPVECRERRDPGATERRRSERPAADVEEMDGARGVKEEEKKGVWDEDVEEV